MKPFFVISLFCSQCIAQLPVVPSATQQTASISPASIGQIERWWNFHDLALNITVSNQWNDEIFGKPLWQMDTANSPTNSALGVRFNAAPFLTNDPVPFNAVGQSNSFLLVMTIENPATETDISDGAVEGGLALDTSSRLRWEAGFVLISSAIPTSTLIDIAVVQTNSAGTAVLKTYTNGVLSSSTTPGGVQRPIRLGFSGIGGHTAMKGYVRHYIYWSNCLSSVDISNLHYWRTNTEGGTP